jgi:hypothetical protein
VAAANSDLRENIARRRGGDVIRAAWTSAGRVLQSVWRVGQRVLQVARGTSPTERRLTLLCWGGAAGLFWWFQFRVSNQNWQDNAFLLNICSGLTASLFGVPIVVLAFTRINRRTAREAAALTAAQQALAAVSGVRQLVADRRGSRNADELWRLRDDVDELLEEWDPGGAGGAMSPAQFDAAPFAQMREVHAAMLLDLQANRTDKHVGALQAAMRQLPEERAGAHEVEVLTIAIDGAWNRTGGPMTPGYYTKPGLNFGTYKLVTEWLERLLAAEHELLILCDQVVALVHRRWPAARI